MKGGTVSSMGDATERDLLDGHYISSVSVLILLPNMLAT